MNQLKKFFLGFYYAAQGIIHAFSGRNMRIHGLATLVVLLTGKLIHLSITEWLIVLMLIGIIWSLEIINTAIEELANRLRDTNHLSYQATKSARDLAAGAVLVMAIIATITASIIINNHF